jgi:hypothetical protein
MMKSFGFWWKTSVVLVAALSMFACGGGGGGGGIESKPRIRYVNASADTSPLTFTLDGNDQATGIAYLGLSALQQQEQNTYDLAVREDGSNPDFDAIATVFQNDREYIVAAIGLENFGAEPLKRVRLFTPEINLTAPNGNRSRIHVLHAFNRSTGLETPAIDMRNPGDNPQYKVENIGYGSIGTLEIDASSQTFVVRRNASESVYVTNTATFDGGGIYLAIVSGVEAEVGALAPTLTFVKLN